MTGFKDIEGYDGVYKIDKNGNVLSVKRKYVTKSYILPIKIGRGGYLQVSLTKSSNRISFYIHRLLAQTFIPNPENKPQVNHKDGNKLNNSLSNLEWVTCRENTIHAHLVGLSMVKSGDENHRFKYNILVYDLNDNYLFTMKGQKDIIRCGFDQGNVYRCLSGKRQTHKNCKFKKEII